MESYRILSMPRFDRILAYSRFYRQDFQDSQESWKSMLQNHAESSRFSMIPGNFGVLKYLASRIPRFLAFWGFSVTESCGILKIPHDSWESWGTQVSRVKNSKIPGNLGIQRYAILGFLTILASKLFEIPGAR